MRYTEALFNPALFEGAPVGFMGVHQQVLDSITKSEIDIRKDLF